MVTISRFSTILQYVKDNFKCITKEIIRPEDPPYYHDLTLPLPPTGGNDTLPDEDGPYDEDDRKPIWWYHTDHLGSSTYLTDNFGRPSHYYETLPFGEMMVEHNQSANVPSGVGYDNKYKFNGKELDDATQMYYYGARYYDPRISIFVSVDPLAEQTMEPYLYTGNNPIMFTDPTGMSKEGGGNGGPGNYSASVNSRYIGFGLRHPKAAARIGFGVTKGNTDISTNATRFATRGEVLFGSARGQEDRGSENGAFRHGLWQATITSEFGSKISKEAGNAHEKNPFTNLSTRVFNNIDDADQTVDLLNNIIGRDIGEKNKGKSMNDLANIVLDEFKNNGLYTATKGDDGNFTISKTKLSDEKYDELNNIFKGLNHNGKTKAEQKASEQKARDYIQSIDTHTKW